MLEVNEELAADQYFQNVVEFPDAINLFLNVQRRGEKVFLDGKQPDRESQRTNALG